ncbi:MAG: SUMF1/EgtB/PvdO family nonheme iron enzyme [Deltaproteobacteria bacterium]|nr:SUMF1/EgtB/PvdO family nonheme iron enzyme [Deltaproteobacteria bacterium]
MRRLAALVFLGVVSLSVLSASSYAETKPQVQEEDELQIEEEMKKESAKKPITKKDLPPINMVYVKGGCYDMGDFEGNGDEDERPVHEVCVNDFYIADTEVTQELFEKVMGFIPAWRYNPTMPRNPKDPVTYVNWFLANQFIQKLNTITKGYYRLPTEAEWEYAARSGGKKERWPGFNNEAEVGSYSWFADNSEFKLQNVKTRKPNGLGLYDMSGSIWEWVEDNFDFDYYQLSPKKDPYGAEFSLYKGVRGGSIADGPFKLRTTYRYALEPSRRLMTVGLRLAE